ncbi:DUF3289 family protein [Photobacterium damselae]|uniref:DUF3289 family protein n=1 Tax=Photobacterium damselae TaxID=38293 RepID=UPI001F307AC5|nr:DUF3289 family protein [Photobacterium damselae]UKA12886.1 DUF3289 family protein [Photobacterium damselae subsp. damselae]
MTNTMARTPPTHHIRRPTEFTLHQPNIKPKAARTSDNELRETLERIEQNNIAQNDSWKPVSGVPCLVYETKRRFNDTNAPDMTHGDEDRATIEQYGFMRPFTNSITSDLVGNVTIEDQFELPASEHFKRMRSLGNYFSNPKFNTPTSAIYSKMVDKFERSEGGVYMHPALDEAMKSHETTTKFHIALLKCLGENIKNGSLPKNILSVTSEYMVNNRLALPHFLILSPDFFNGTVLTVHGIWAMRIFVDKLEYKASKIRGRFRYEIQDHFGLNTDDINHNENDDFYKQFEWLAGFRSWYLLQHYKGYGYQPFITEIRFTL